MVEMPLELKKRLALIARILGNMDPEKARVIKQRAQEETDRQYWAKRVNLIISVVGTPMEPVYGKPLMDYPAWQLEAIYKLIARGYDPISAFKISEAYTKIQTKLKEEEGLPDHQAGQEAIQIMEAVLNGLERPGNPGSPAPLRSQRT